MRSVPCSGNVALQPGSDEVHRGAAGTMCFIVIGRCCSASSPGLCDSETSLSRPVCLPTALMWPGLSLLCLPSFCENDSQTRMSLSQTVCEGIGMLLLSLLCCCAGPAAALKEVCRTRTQALRQKQRMAPPILTSGHSCSMALDRAPMLAASQTDHWTQRHPSGLPMQLFTSSSSRLLRLLGGGLLLRQL